MFKKIKLWFLKKELENNVALLTELANQFDVLAYELEEMSTKSDEAKSCFFRANYYAIALNDLFS